MEKQFVRFYSPGTFVPEVSLREINSWDVETAVEMSKSIKERYDASPYGFDFITKERTDDELDSHISKESPMYYLGGTVLTLEQVKAENNPPDNILIKNMETNGYEKVLINDNSWRWTAVLGEDDVVLDYAN